MIIKGDLNIYQNYSLESLGNLKEVTGILNIINCEKLKTLNKLTTTRKLVASDCLSLESLGNLEWVNFHVKLDGCKNLKSLGKLKHGAIFINLEECENLKDLGQLEEVNGVINLKDCSSLTNLGKLTKVNGMIFLYGSGITREYVILNKPELLRICNWER